MGMFYIGQYLNIMCITRIKTSKYFSQIWRNKNHQPRPCFLSSVLVSQSYITCLKHVTLKAWQREFSVGYPVRVFASNLLLINIFLDIVVRIESKSVIKAKDSCLAGLLIRSIFHWENCTRAEALVQFFREKSKRIDSPTRHVLLHKLLCVT